MASEGRTILRVDSGVDHGRSVSRQLADDEAHRTMDEHLAVIAGA